MSGFVEALRRAEGYARFSMQDSRATAIMIRERIKEGNTYVSEANAELADTLAERALGDIDKLRELADVLDAGRHDSLEAFHAELDELLQGEGS